MSVNSPVNDLINEFFEKLSQTEGIFPYLYNANRKVFDRTKHWVFYSGPVWDIEEPKAAIEAFITGKWLVAGENVARFENTYSKKYGFSASLMVNSGSSANLVLISAAKKYFNWKDGDEVIVSPVGFPTTIAPLMQNNLVPRFVDIDFSDLNFNLDQVEKVINSRTKAIFISPVLGNAPDMDRIVAIAKKNGITLLLDGCDSLGSKWDGKDLSDYAFATSCSFYPAHHITTGEGGMVSARDKEFIALARSFAWWGRDCYCVGSTNLTKNGACNKRFDKWLDDVDEIVDHKYVFSNVGYNLKPLDMQGAIGLKQLAKLDEIHSKRREMKNRIGAMLTKHLKGTVRIPGEHPKAETSWFGVPILCNSAGLKSKLVAHLEAHRIQTRNYFAGNILLHPAYKHLDNKDNFPNANRVLSEVFFLGCHPTYSEEILAYIEDVISDFAKTI
jgi:CDP-6-deoxy-D-xylo-4-hexulose-3-dehydrase